MPFVSLAVSLVLLLGLARVSSGAPGAVDPTFGIGGRVIREFGGLELARALTVQPDGKLVVAGSYATDEVALFLLMRYQPDGSLDPSFGAGGVVLSDFGGAEYPIYALAVQPDGRLVVSSSVPSSGSTFTLVRYLPDGSLDSTFGRGGLVSDFPEQVSPAALALALQPDGKLVAVGHSAGDVASTHLLLARYLTADGCRGTGPFRVWGRVTGATSGSGLRGVGLTLTGPGECMEATISKFLGGYTVRDLGEGTYTVTPSQDGCTFEPPSQTVTLAGGHAAPNFTAACPAE